MNWKKNIKNPLDILAEYMAPRRNVPVDIMRVRYRYLFFSQFPNLFNQEEYLHLFKSMLDVYIKTLEVVYGNYPLNGNKFVVPSKRLNDLYMMLNGFMTNVMINPRFDSGCRIPKGKFSELRLNHQGNIQLWATTKTIYIDLMSEITQDICLKTRYGVKPEKFFRFLFKLLNKELQKHLIKRIKQGSDIYFDVPFPTGFRWIDSKTYSVGHDALLVFDKPGSPQTIFSHLESVGGEWVSKSDLVEKAGISDDSLRSIISVLRKKIAETPKVAEKIGIQNDGSSNYRLALRMILSPSLD